MHAAAAATAVCAWLAGKYRVAYSVMCIMRGKVRFYRSARGWLREFLVKLIRHGNEVVIASAGCESIRIAVYIYIILFS